jgi:hypothetical protein
MDRRGDSFPKILEKALCPGQNDLLTSNVRLQLLYEFQTIPDLYSLMGVLGLG